MNGQSIKLYQHQLDLLKRNPNKWLLAWQTGTGKTIASLKLVKGKVLIIVPKSLKKQWQEQTRHLVLTKEEFKKKADTLPKYDCLLIDEIHYFSGYKSQMHKRLVAYIRKYKIVYIYGLTATPFMSSVWSIFALGIILGKDWKWHKWNSYFFNHVRMGNRRVPVPKKNINGEPVKDIVARLVNQLGNTVRMDECVDLPEQTFKTEYFGLHASQKRAIKNIIDVIPIVRWTKIHQICGGTQKGDGYTKDEFYKSEKLDRLKDLLQEHKKVIIVCRYNNEITYVRDEIADINDNVYVINGAVKNKHEILEKANNQDECVLIVNAACSEGWEAPTFPTMIFYSLDWSLKNAVQMQGRISRINKLKKNLYIYFVVKDNVDEEVYKCIMKKEDFHATLYKK